ncbi:MAG: hypothetical protein AAF388_04590, partial [Bacteroidota bacterium]
MKNTLLLLVPVALFLSSCKLTLDEDIPSEVNEIAETTFDDSFDFNTSRVVEVNIEDEGNTNSVFEILAVNPAGEEEVVAAGRSIKGKLEFSLNLPSYLEQLTIAKQSASGESKQEFSITNDEVNARISNFQASQSSFCVDHLYVVNNQKGFYKIDVSDDNFNH